MTHELHNSDVHINRCNQGSPRDLRDRFYEANPSEELLNEDASLEQTSSQMNVEEQFDLMASKVNEAMQYINSIYKDIGFSSIEIAEKKSEIFKTMNNTIASFKSSLQREKSSISSECEWLRQQIRIILSMLNDSKGAKYLNLTSRGIVFDDEKMYANGRKEDVLLRMSKCHSPGLATGMLNTGISGDISLSPSDISFSGGEMLGSSLGSLESELFSANPMSRNVSGTGDDYRAMSSGNSNLSLLDYKSRLNSIFLDVLKVFVKIYRRFNEVNRVFWDNVEAITEDWREGNFPSLIHSIPTRSEAEEHSLLFDEFDAVLAQLKLTDRSYIPGLRGGVCGAKSEDVAFIISSPRKKQVSTLDLPSTNDTTMESMSRLRSVNDKLIHAIRGLKLTKISNEVISQLMMETESTERQIVVRIAKMKEAISECLNLIDSLSLAESDLIAIQRMQNYSEHDTRNSSSGEGLFEIDTLKFIQINPREFGLMDHHLNFVTKLANTLRIIKENKEKKWIQYSHACANLWEKLGEHKEYTARFMENNSKLTDISLSNFKSELKRLYTKRAEYVDNFILDARKEISCLQVQLLYSARRCEEFKFYNYDTNGDYEDKERVLNEHEAEIEKLKEEYEEKKEVLTLYASLNELLEDQRFLIESSKDSSRLLSKNSCKILLNEERVRKKIGKNLPKVLASLKKEISDYNNRMLSKGLHTITAGNDDMLEKILSIESSLGMQGTKHTRGKVTSPQKSRSNISTRSSSPTKQSQSPMRVLKPNSQRRPLSNTGSASIPRRDGIQRSPQAGNRISPTQRFDKNSKSVSPQLPQQGNSRMNTENGTTVLKPLMTSLTYKTQDPPRTSLSSKPTFSRGNTNESSYSVCSRVSPLRPSPNLNRSFSNSFSPLKVPESSHDVDMNKENSFTAMSGKPNFQKTTGAQHENYRLSSGSVANSTIMGDDYQSWRDERIKLINGEDVDLC